MGSFQIVYDDFSGGHYMGDRTASLPKNTWYGTNAALSGKGELVPGSVGQVAQFTAPYASNNIGDADIYYGSIWGENAIYIARWRDAGLLNQTSRMYRIAQMTGTPTTTTTTLVGEVAGKCAFVDDFATFGQYIYYANFDNGDIRKIDLSTNTDSLVSSAIATKVPESLVNYKSRVLAYGGACYQRLFYSDNTKTTFNLTQYYEFPGDILNVVPRSNDVLVITTDGLYSATGVFGTSLNIQQIMPANEILKGMLSAKAAGRAIYFLGETQIYQMLGATSAEIATLDIADSTKSFNIVQGGLLSILNSNGSWYANEHDGPFVRMKSSDTNFSTYGNSFVAEPLNLGRNFWDSTGFTSAAVMDSSSNLRVFMCRYLSNYAGPVINGASSTSPASASVDISEYWHQKQMSVKELLIEAVYDTNASTGLTGNATVAAQIIPTGAVDYTVNQTSALTSTVQTYTTTLSGVNANSSRVLHRFRVDDAIKGYGFYPRITWQGCRIRRVIAVCED